MLHGLEPIGAEQLLSGAQAMHELPQSVETALSLAKRAKTWELKEVPLPTESSQSDEGHRQA